MPFPLNFLSTFLTFPSISLFPLFFFYILLFYDKEVRKNIDRKEKKTQ